MEARKPADEVIELNTAALHVRQSIEVLEGQLDSAIKAVHDLTAQRDALGADNDRLRRYILDGAWRLP